MSSLFLVYNAKIWSAKGLSYTWMVFNRDDGYIGQTGTDNPPVSHFTDGCKRDYGGKRILPGLQEAHIHVSDFGGVLLGLDLIGCNSIDQLQSALAEYCANHPEMTWITGFNVDESKLGRLPTKEDIDVICSDRPVMLTRICIHMSVLNSLALKMAGIDDSTANPPGGLIERYPDGHPLAGHINGVIKEKVHINVCDIIEQTSDSLTARIQAGLQYCLQQGVTSVHSNEEASWKEYCKLADANQLPIRVFYVGFFYAKDKGNFPSFPGETRGDMLSCDRTKLFTDGALGADTAALTENYIGKDVKGFLLYPQDEFSELASAATCMGYRLEIHVIGDAAVDCALNALEAAKVSPQKRPILTHCQILREDHLQKMKEHGVVANVQPQMVCSDSRWLEDRIPQKLMKTAYSWKTINDKGITLAGGSDAPVEDPRPLLGIYDAVFRPVADRASANHKQFKPEECLSIDDAIEMYTLGGAYATMKEHCLGKLLPGYQADFVVLDSPRDICDYPRDLLQTTIQEVWVKGQQRL